MIYPSSPLLLQQIFYVEMMQNASNISAPNYVLNLNLEKYFKSWTKIFIPGSGPLVGVASTVQQGSNISLAPPSNVNHQNSWKSKNKISFD